LRYADALYEMHQAGTHADYNMTDANTMYQTYMGEYSLKPSISESNAEVLYIYGEKEMRCVKESAKCFKQMHSNCTLYEAKGYNHGYLSIYLPLEWIRLVNPFLENSYSSQDEIKL